MPDYSGFGNEKLLKLIQETGNAEAEMEVNNRGNTVVEIDVQTPEGVTREKALQKITTRSVTNAAGREVTERIRVINGRVVQVY